MNKKYTKPILQIAIIIMVQLFVTMLVSGQNLISADPSDTFDSEALFINPAVIPFQHRQVMLGMKVYQLGFLKSQELGLHTSYFGLSLPEDFLGFIDLGLTGQNFSVPVYDQTNFSLLIANQPLERLSIGIKYNLFTKSYHQKYFDLVNPDDPVFAAGTLKLAHSLGAGIVLFPWSTLSIGFSCDHLNRPDVSLFQDKYKQPLIYDFGFRYSWRYFSSSVYLNRLQQHWQFNWVFESRPSASSVVKLGVVQRAAKIAAQLNIVPGLALNYAFDYPFYEINQLSNGSHQISIMYDLDHRDKIKELQFSDFDDGKFPIFNLQSQFFVEISCANLEILTRKIVRSVDDRIPGNALKHLTGVELALDDSSYQIQNFYERGAVQNQNLMGLYNSAKYSKVYTDYLEQFADNSTSNSLSSVQLIANPNSMRRAMELRNSLITHYSFLDQQINIKQLENDPVTKGIEPLQLSQASNMQNSFLNPDSVSFHISSLKMRRYNGFWKLIISDYSGHEIKIFANQGHVPDEIFWDWRDEQGNFIKPDIYYYFFQWEGKNGKIKRSEPKTFTVTKIARTLEIDIRSKPDNLKDQGNAVEIKLAN